MSKLKVNIVSASEEIFSGEADMVFATGALGEIGVAPGHSPLLTGLLPGPVRVASGSEEDTFFCSGGFIEVQPDVVTLLSDVAVRAEDIDEAEAEKAREEAEKIKNDSEAGVDFSRARAELAEAAARLQTLRKLRKK